MLKNIHEAQSMLTPKYKKENAAEHRSASECQVQASSPKTFKEKLWEIRNTEDEYESTLGMKMS